MQTELSKIKATQKSLHVAKGTQEQTHFLLEEKIDELAQELKAKNDSIQRYQENEDAFKKLIAKNKQLENENQQQAKSDFLAFFILCFSVRIFAKRFFRW